MGAGRLIRGLLDEGRLVTAPVTRDPPHAASSQRIPLIAGIPLTNRQIEAITAAGADVLWHGDARRGQDSPAPEEDVDLADALDQAVAWFGPGLSPRRLMSCGRLKWLQTNSGGVEAILSRALIRSPVVVTNTAGLHASTTAEHALALMLALARDISGSVLAQSRGVWAPTPVVGIAPLEGARLVVVGTGAVGTAIAERARAFGMDVHGVNRSGSAHPAFRSVWPVGELAEAATECDWLVVAAPSTPGSRGIVSAGVLAAMKPSSIVINVGRGELVDELALIRALQSGRLWAAGLDVFVDEPLAATSPLWGIKNVLITAHVGGVMRDYADRVVDLLTANLLLFRAGRPLQGLVDKDAGY